MFSWNEASIFLQKILKNVILYDNILGKEVVIIFEIDFYQKENGRIPVKESSFQKMLPEYFILHIMIINTYY